MSNVDWSLAPDDATHFDCRQFVSPSFMRKCEGSTHWMFYGGGEWHLYGGLVDAEEAKLIERPKHKPWSGPEDGLPPVGSVCEVENPLEDGQWCKVKILAWDAECAVFQAEADYPYVYDGQGIEGFRPLRTPEQRRESAIRELMDIAQVDCRVTAARLVDAGFKREVV